MNSNFLGTLLFQMVDFITLSGDALSMNENMSNKKRNHISASVIIYTILSFVIVVAIGMPVIQSQYIYPSFVDQIISSTEEQAVMTGSHMKKNLLKGYINGNIRLSEEIKTELEETSKDYNLWKIKVFSKSGETLYSSSKEDIGKINQKAYFHNIVAKGNIFTKVVVKNTHSLEDQIISSDVLETYIPVMQDDEFIGAFELYYNITARKEAMDELISNYNRLLYILTIIIIIVVLFTIIGFKRRMREKKRFEDALFEMANTDKLTEIFNRRRFGELLQLEIDKYDRYKADASILLFDIDHFKKVNDTYGHQSGDDVLVGLVRLCKKVLRKSDILGRFGGEEFMVLLSQTDQEGTFQTAERLCQAVDSAFIQTCTGKVHVTISIGIAHFKDADPLTIDNLIKQADKSLYSAKTNGRNRVVYLSPPNDIGS